MTSFNSPYDDEVDQEGFDLRVPGGFGGAG